MAGPSPNGPQPEPGVVLRIDPRDSTALAEAMAAGIGLEWGRVSFAVRGGKVSYVHVDLTLHPDRESVGVDAAAQDLRHG